MTRNFESQKGGKPHFSVWKQQQKTIGERPGWPAGMPGAYLDQMSMGRNTFKRCWWICVLMSLLAGWWWPVVSLQGATNYVASMNQSDMQYWSTHAQDGDVFIFPAGTANYTSTNFPNQMFGFGVLWTNAVTLQFVPGRSIITNTTPYRVGFDYVLGFDTRAGGKPIRVSGLTVEGKKTGSGIYFYGNQKNSRVDHCVFNYCVHRGLYFQGFQCYGLVDHCSFTNCEICFEHTGGESASYNKMEDQYYGLGTTNAVVVEDCYFYEDDGNGYAWRAPCAGPIFVYGGSQGSRAVFRHNTVKSVASGSYGAPFLDLHGNNGVLPVDQRGTIFFALENNTIDILGAYLLIGVRGGCFIMQSNTLINPRPSAAAVAPTEEESWRGALLGMPGNRASWPAQDQITNTWFVANTMNGAPLTAATIMNYMIAVHPEDAAFIQEGRDFFVTNAIPAPGFNNPRIPGGWHGYRPLSYPHPRILLDGEVITNVPSSAVISVSPPTLDFGVVTLGSNKDLTVMVQNIGGATLTGTATVAAPFSIVGASSYSLSNAASQTLVVRYTPTADGQNSQILNFTGGGGASVDLSGSGTSQLPVATFSAASGTISAPFAIQPDGTISQSVWTGTPAEGGRASYTFTITQAGNYMVAAEVYALDESQNSFFINIDREPFSPINIWSITPSTGFIEQFVTWPVVGSLTLHVWWLNAGTHQLIVRGREANTALRQIAIWQYLPALNWPSMPNPVNAN